MTQAITADFVSRPASVLDVTLTQIGESAFFQTVYRDDLANVFFNLQEFAETGMIYHTDLAAWFTYSVLFDDPKTSMRFGTDADVTELKPQVMVATRALKAPIQKTDRVIVRGVRYQIEDIDSDGVGVTSIFLRWR